MLMRPLFLISFLLMSCLLKAELNTAASIGTNDHLSKSFFSFVGFTAKNANNRICLQWSTMHEQNSLHFQIEKSSEGQNFNWNDLVVAIGNGTSRNNYEYIDEHPFAGENFYRIKQVDSDGKFAYSTIVSIIYQPKGLARKYLNPLQHVLFVELTGYDPNLHTNDYWQLFDKHGRPIASERINGNVIYGKLPPFIPAGIYFLKLAVNHRRETIKLIKQ